MKVIDVAGGASDSQSFGTLGRGEDSDRQCNGGKTDRQSQEKNSGNPHVIAYR